MKRAPALVPLARDHHDALVLARRAARAGKADTPVDELRREVLTRWQAEIEPHFAVEEAVLLPALAAAGALAEADETRRQHAQLRALTAALPAGDAAALAAWGTALLAHVRFEDRELFPLAERLLDLDALAPALHRPAP